MMNDNGLAKYYLAKYIPDMERHEPRNIGVILQQDSDVIFGFFETDEDSIPSFIRDNNAYVQWINFWKKEISAGKSMKEICESSNGSYAICEAGILLDRVNDMNDAIDYLFKRLVL